MTSDYHEAFDEDATTNPSRQNIIQHRTLTKQMKKNNIAAWSVKSPNCTCPALAVRCYE